MKDCRNCVLRDPTNKICQLFKKETEDTETCPGYTSRICEHCGQPMVGDPGVIEMDSAGLTLTICNQCASRPPCARCTAGPVCRFEQDGTVPGEPYVMKQMRQGNMYVQQQVRNTDRENLTCRAGCICWNSEEKICMKITCGMCNNWRINK